MNRNWPPPDGTVQVLAGVKLHHPQHAIALLEHIGVGRFDHLAEVVLQAYRGQALGTGDKLGTLDHATLLQLAAHTYPRLVGLTLDVQVVMQYVHAQRWCPVSLPAWMLPLAQQAKDVDLHVFKLLTEAQPVFRLGQQLHMWCTNQPRWLS